jgi:hypothetical protein
MQVRGSEMYSFRKSWAYPGEGLLTELCSNGMIIDFDTAPIVQTPCEELAVFDIVWVWKNTTNPVQAYLALISN